MLSAINISVLTFNFNLTVKSYFFASTIAPHGNIFSPRSGCTFFISITCGTSDLYNNTFKKINQIKRYTHCSNDKQNKSATNNRNKKNFNSSNIETHICCLHQELHYLLHTHVINVHGYDTNMQSTLQQFTLFI